MTVSPPRTQLRSSSPSPSPETGPAPEVKQPASDPENLLERRIKQLTSVLAPTTVLTALLLYYGYVATNTEYGFFGISLSSLRLSNQDFLLRSVAALYLPLGALLLGMLIAMWGHAGVRHLISARRRQQALRRAALGLIVVGTLAFLRGIAGMLLPDLSRTEPIATSPLCLGLGVCALAYGRYLFVALTTSGPSPSQPKTWVEQASAAVVSGLVVLSLFWAANSFAGAYGRGAAAVTAADLSRRPAVVLDTTERLFISFPGIVETSLPVAQASKFRFRYRGLRLLVESDGRLFLVPDQWRSDDGATLVVRDNEDIRIQFHRG